MFIKRNKMHKRTITQIILDKTLLIITAIAVGISLLGLTFVLRDYFSIADDWVLFILWSLFYSVMFSYFAFTLSSFKKYPQKGLFLSVLVLITLTPVFLLLIIFYFDIVPLPNYLLPYLIGSVVLAPAFLMLFEYCLKELERRRTKNKGSHQIVG